MKAVPKIDSEKKNKPENGNKKETDSQNADSQNMGSQKKGNQNMNPQNMEKSEYEFSEHGEPNMNPQNMGNQNVNPQRAQSQNMYPQHAQSHNMDLQSMGFQDVSASGMGNQNRNTQNKGSLNTKPQNNMPAGGMFYGNNEGTGTLLSRTDPRSEGPQLGCYQEDGLGSHWLQGHCLSADNQLPLWDDLKCVEVPKVGFKTVARAASGIKVGFKGNMLNVNFAKAGEARIQVFDMMGHVVDSRVANVSAGATSSLKNMANGNYVVRVMMNGAAKTALSYSISKYR